MAIRAYHEAAARGHRNVCLIPLGAWHQSRHAPSWRACGWWWSACDERGNVDLADLKDKAEQHAADLAAMMLTYPSTHGVFEEAIIEICEIVHAPRRPGLHRRRQHECHGGPVPRPAILAAMYAT